MDRPCSVVSRTPIHTSPERTHTYRLGFAFLFVVLLSVFDCLICKVYAHPRDVLNFILGILSYVRISRQKAGQSGIVSAAPDFIVRFTQHDAPHDSTGVKEDSPRTHGFAVLCWLL